MGRKPEYRIILQEKGDGKDTNYDAGVGWKSKWGGVTIQLRPGVVIDYETCKRFFVNVNPYDPPPRVDDESSSDDNLPIE